MLLAIDVGNSRASFGLWDGSKWHTWFLPSSPLPNLDAILASIPSDFNVSEVVCCTVVPDWQPLVAELGSYLKTGAKFVRADYDWGFSVAYSNRAKLGTDRIVNDLAAFQKFPLPCIVIDVGTAATFDVLALRDDVRWFLGGVILPGPETMRNSLFKRTAQLPEVKLEWPEKVIGTSTDEAIQSGILHFFAEGVDGMVRRLCGELGEPATVVMTGGLSGLIFPECKEVHHLEPFLTMDGLRIAFEMMR